MKGKMKFLMAALITLLSMEFNYAQSYSYEKPVTFKQNNDVYVEKLTNLNWFNKNTNNNNTAKEVIQDNEFERNEAGELANFYLNPLLLNGRTLDLNNFFLGTKGILSVVKGKPETNEAKAIPFYVYIRRDGKIIEDSKMSFLNKTLFKIELSDIFPFCKRGDLLIIKPVRGEDWKAKRILKLIEGC
jgi:hypothetical protein